MSSLDPTRPLKNVRHENFVQALLQGVSQTAAYTTAGYGENGARANAARLMTRDDIVQRLDYLREQVLDDRIMSAKEALVELSDIARNATSTRDRLGALNSLMRYHGLFTDHLDLTSNGETLPQVSIYLPDNGRDPTLAN